MAKTVSPTLPGPDILAGITLLIDQRVKAQLQALGITQSAPDPRAIRQAKGLSVAEIAAKSGLSTAVISKIECGRSKRPAADTLNAIARALGVSESDYRASVAALIQRSVK